MNKQKGFTLMELMISIAILVILVLMMAPLMGSITKSNKATQDLNKLDLNVGRTVDVFKRAVRSSKPIESGWGVTGSAIYLSNLTGGKDTTTSVAIVVNVPKEVSSGSGTYIDEKVIFYYDSINKKLMLNSTTDATATSFGGIGNPVTLVTDVLDAKFGYNQNVATIYMKVQLDKNNNAKFKEIRDAAVTRINIKF